MNTVATRMPMLWKISSLLLTTASFVIVACCLTFAQSLPQVHLDAGSAAPRPVEDLTETTVSHHYALAWRDMASALDSGRSDLTSQEFVGFAKDRLDRRIAEQRDAGLHVRIVDHGHHLKVVFYASDGTAMQLLDQAQLEIQTFDGNKLLSTDNEPREYIVLMTPGADRWYVRDLQEVTAKSF